MPTTASPSHPLQTHNGARPAGGKKGALDVATPRLERMHGLEKAGFGLGILIFGLVLLTQFLAVWPAMIAGAEAGAGDQRITVLLGVTHVVVAPSVAVLAGVMLAGMLGALAYMVRQFTLYALRDELTKRAEWWYVLLPIQAAALATIVYFALQGGLIGAGQTTALNPYGLAAIAGLVGLFARHAMQTLSKVFTALFDSPEDKNVAPTK
jgi:hypothetical protein